MAEAFNFPKHISFRGAQVGQAHALAGSKRQPYEVLSRGAWRDE